MKIKCWCLLLLGLVINSCKQEPVDMGIIEPYFPSATHLRQGIVSKFYEHYIPKNKDRNPYTNISYRSYKFDNPHWLTLNIYNAGMELSAHYKYQITDNQWIIKESFYCQKGDTVHADIKDNIIYDWTGEQAITTLYFHENNYTNIYTNQQIAIADTIVADMTCKNIYEKESLKSINPEKDTTKQEYTITTTFAPNLGMYSRSIDKEEVVVNLELVEQMSLSQFEKRANHGKKRMAYIDPENTIDDHSNFKLCNHEASIGDYYNCDNPGQLKGGKGTWWRVLDKALDPQKLKKESGFLTYRFVLNCKGEVGRFMIEESSLNFEKKNFDKETVQHLYEIVSSQTDWQACTGMRKQSDLTQDAYTYITFKLKDGKIIDLLP